MSLISVNGFVWNQKRPGCQASGVCQVAKRFILEGACCHQLLAPEDGGAGGPESHGSATELQPLLS